MKKIIFLICLAAIHLTSKAQTNPVSESDPKTAIWTTLSLWHKAAANTNFDSYFGLMTDDAIFIGTDATENWTLEEFKAFSKPHFDRGKAWNFSTLERNIYVQEKANIAWFDELLDTQMGICRGSGILEKTVTGWKIKHYVLSIAIPNENVEEITMLKKVFDTNLIKELNYQQH